MKEVLGDFAIWTGAVVGLLKIVDWLLIDPQKEWLSDKFESMWIWLSDQRMGSFTTLVKNRRTQIGFSIFTHVAIIAMILSFLARVFWGVGTGSSLELGHPRIYTYQVWVDVAALIVSAFYVSRTVHPRMSLWITDTDNLRQYYWRAFTALLKSFGVMFLILLVQLPIIYPLFDSPVGKGEAAIVAYVENAFGGQFVVTLLHGVTAFISAPVLAEVLMLQTILFLSIYWLVFVFILIITFRILQFILERVVENKNGPVLALSGLLVGIGAIIKAIIA